MFCKQLVSRICDRGGNLLLTDLETLKPGLGSRLDMPMPSNMLPKPSSSELPKTKSESNKRGGVAVLALLPVAALPRTSVGNGGSGGPPGESVGDGVGNSFDLPVTPREKVRAELRRKPGLEDAGGGTGMSLY